MKIIKLIFGVCIFTNFSCNNPQKLARSISKLDIPKEATIEYFNSTSQSNGDNETYIVLKIDSINFERLKTECIKKQYIQLPTNKIQFDNLQLKYFDNIKGGGMYKILTEKSDIKHYTIVILNIINNRIIIYNSFI